MKLYLASMSQRRRNLLGQLDIPFESLDIMIDETRRSQEMPISYVERMAKEKAEAGLALLSEEAQGDALILAADTIVVLEDQILDKPVDQQQAQSMLRQLSGRSHVVMTAYALKSIEKTHIKRVNTTVFFRHILESEVTWYWNSGEQMGKAGGYAIQGLAGIFVNSISGSYSSVVGLPMAELVGSLREFGISFPADRQ